MQKSVFEVQTILCVKPKFDLNNGQTIEPTTKFVKVFAVTKNGTPQVIPLNDDLTPQDSAERYYKNMKWSNNGWKVYGHYTEIYVPK